mmetsp:Transcript_5055/g.11733  ORF Transcript_5055/g.11733 Transcript_5055/m.11733 type:complete len:104 (+) Transcript_5055:537-848(+)
MEHTVLDALLQSRDIAPRFAQACVCLSNGMQHGIAYYWGLGLQTHDYASMGSGAVRFRARLGGQSSSSKSCSPPAAERLPADGRAVDTRAVRLLSWTRSWSPR